MFHRVLKTRSQRRPGHVQASRAVRFLASAVATLAASVALQAPAWADASYPNRPIKLVVPIGAGGATDAVARAFAAELSKDLGQSVVVENRPGANGTIATNAMLRSPADGYTWLLGTIGTHSVNQYLYGSLPYDPVKDFMPVSMLAKVTNVVVVPEDSPVRSLADFVTLAKSKPGELNYGVGTIGSSSHLATEMFMVQNGLDLLQVPYNGPSQASVDLIAGRLDILFSPVINEIGNIKGGKVRALGHTGATRAAALPDVPTVAEQGYAGYEASGWNGLFMAAGTPPAIVEQVSAAVRKAAESPAIVALFNGQGVEAAVSTPEAFTEFLVNDRKKWSALINQAGIAAEPR